MSLRAIPAPVRFVAALVPMVASQIVRLHQHDPGTWFFWDYAGRFGGWAMLAAIPSARAVAFRRERLRMGLWKVALWIAGIAVVDHYLGGGQTDDQYGIAGNGARADTATLVAPRQPAGC